MSDDDRYIEVTATIGPIEPPYKLHTFGDGGGEVHTTVHGDRAQRIFEAVNEVDHEADLSARIVTQEELDQPPHHEVVNALGDAFDGSLVESVRRVRVERDRLRAVVEAVSVMWDDITAVDPDGTSMQFPTVPHYDAIDQGLDALGLLDGSGIVGGSDAE